MFTNIKYAILSSLFVATAYGTTLPQQQETVFTHEPNYKRIDIAYRPQSDAIAKTQCSFFATNNVFKVRGSLETQIGENISLNLGATVQSVNGENKVIPKMSADLRLPNYSIASLAYDGLKRIATLSAKLYF